MTPTEAIEVLGKAATDALTAYAIRLELEDDPEATRKVALYRDDLIAWLDRSIGPIIALAGLPKLLH